MAVAEGNFGRLGEDEQQRYTTGNARIQLDPSVWEMPGAMPEIAPSPDFEANIDRPLIERSMVLQAWGTYRTLWPVVHHQLGVSPDIGRGELAVVPQVPDGQSRCRQQHPARERVGRCHRRTRHIDSYHDRDPAPYPGPADRPRATRQRSCHLGDVEWRTDGLRRAFHGARQRCCGRRRTRHRHEHPGGHVQLIFRTRSG